MLSKDPEKCRNDGCSGTMKPIALPKKQSLLASSDKLPTHFKCSECGSTVSSHRIVMAAADTERPHTPACTLSSRQLHL